MEALLPTLLELLSQRVMSLSISDLPVGESSCSDGVCVRASSLRPRRSHVQRLQGNAAFLHWKSAFFLLLFHCGRLETARGKERAEKCRIDASEGGAYEYAHLVPPARAKLHRGPWDVLVLDRQVNKHLSRPCLSLSAFQPR